MTMKTRLVSLFAVVTMAALTIASTALAEEELAAAEKSAPTFRLPVYNTKEVGQSTLALDQYAGESPADKQTKLVVVSFMASFCGPCKKEMPYLQSLHEKNKERGLRVMMIAIDRDEDGQKKIHELIAANKVTFPVLKDRFNLVARRWLGSESKLPSLFLVRPDGIIQEVHRGYDQDGTELLAKAVETALSKK